MTVDLYDAGTARSWAEVEHDKFSERDGYLKPAPESSYAEALASTYPRVFVAWLGKAYAKARPKTATSLDALQILHKVWRQSPERILAILPDLKKESLPNPTELGADDALQFLCSSLGWEQKYQSLLTGDILANPLLNPKQRLSNLLRAEQEADDLRRRAYDFSSQEDSTHLDTKRFVDLMESWLQVGEAVSSQEKELIKRATAQEQALFWKERFGVLYSRISSQYKGMGAQYEVLVNSLCNTIIRLEKADASPISSDPNAPLTPVLETREFVALQSLLTSQVNQLQRYTEAQKTEVIKTEVNAAMLRILEIVEHAVAPDYPLLWSNIVQEVRAAIQTSQGTDRGDPVLEQSPAHLLSSPPEPEPGFLLDE